MDYKFFFLLLCPWHGMNHGPTVSASVVDPVRSTWYVFCLPDPDPLVRTMDPNPDPSIIKEK
jgi:hypothetical protein